MQWIVLKRLHNICSKIRKYQRKWHVVGQKKGKGIPITGHEGPRGMWMQGSTYSQLWH